MGGSGALLPELGAVPWRPLASDAGLARRERLWTAITIAHTLPFLAAGTLLIALQPLSAPVAVICLAHAWIIPALYARRGANVVRRAAVTPGDPVAERQALGLLGDLLDHDARELQSRSGLALERGAFGVWLLGEAGALLVRPGGRRVHCYCVRVNDAELPGPDRTAHLLLALRADERGFATVANLAFAGAIWRVRRRLEPALREALAEAARRSTDGRVRPA